MLSDAELSNNKDLFTFDSHGEILHSFLDSFFANVGRPVVIVVGVIILVAASIVSIVIAIVA